MKFRYLFLIMAIAGISLCGLSSVPAQAQVGVGITVGTPPPPLPVYDQPDIPGPGYMWTPGYWAWDSNDQDYHWVPGTWILPPQIGFLWTPGWWGWNNGGYCWNNGYWGPHVGFYGGVCYGHGYYGNGYQGGRWDHGQFYYNREANNFRNDRVTNVYNQNVDRRHSNVSYNGGRGGLAARPTVDQERIDRESHLGATAEQNRHTEAASTDRNLRYSANHGRPDVSSTSRAGVIDRSANNNNGNHTEGAPTNRHDDAFTGGDHHQATHDNAVTGVDHNQATRHDDAFTGGDHHQAEANAVNHTSSGAVHNDLVKSSNSVQPKTEPKPEQHHFATASNSVVHHSEHQVSAPVHHEAAAPVHHFSASAPHQSGGQVHMSGGGGGGHPSGGGHSGGGGGHSGGGGHGGGHK